MYKTFYLEDVEELNKENRRDFLIPSKEDIKNIKIGDQVKLIFRFNEILENGCNGERMWVKVNKIQGENFCGTLDNDPYYLDEINHGDNIEFKSKALF